MDSLQEKRRQRDSSSPDVTVGVSTTDAIESGGLPKVHFEPWKEKKWSILAYWSIIMFCNLAIPCLIYYPIRSYTRFTLRDAIGAGSASLGVSTVFEFPLRLYRLWRHREKYGPLNDNVWWHFDSFMHSYMLGMSVATIPLVVAPSVDPPLLNFFLMFTAMLVGTMGVIMIPSLFNLKSITWISSDPPGTKIKPAVFYMVEDICAVDAGKGRQFRREWNARYEASPPFRSFMYQLTVFWCFGCFAYVGICAAVAFTASVDFAFGLTLALVFIWGGSWYAITEIWIWIFLKKEKEWWEKRTTKKQTA